MVAWQLSVCLATHVTHQWTATATATCQKITSVVLHAAKPRVDLSFLWTTPDLGRLRQKAFAKVVQPKK
jgi:hypothetical protein